MTFKSMKPFELNIFESQNKTQQATCTREVLVFRLPDGGLCVAGGWVEEGGCGEWWMVWLVDDVGQIPESLSNKPCPSENLDFFEFRQRILATTQSRLLCMCKQ